MARVITFSRFFPSYHPKAGQPTYFVEKFWCSLFSEVPQQYREPFENYKNPTESILWSYRMHGRKYHTIREGSRWKVGDKFSPRVWSGRPYNSKQVIIAPDTEVKKVWDFRMLGGMFAINGIVKTGETEGHHELLEFIAKNDGLSKDDLLKWFQFPKPFTGQIICWNDKIEY